MEFYGRVRQQKQLHNLFAGDGQYAALVYGRRRVGKSELIKQCLRNEEIYKIYYECKQTTELNNTESLSVLVSEQFGFPVLGYRSMEELLAYLFHKSTETSIILVLDEYPYLRDTVKGLDSILQTLIDRYKDNGHMKLVLCGSYIDIMKSLLERENPLFGRIDLSIDLKPMDYYESSLFYPDYPAEDKVRLYSVFGGIPYYNRLINTGKSVRENIQELVSSPESRLENEVSMYLRSEISRVGNANEVFEALASGFSRFSDILSQSHVSSGPTLADILDKLMRMELVEKQAPINDPGNRRKAGYYISDPLSQFYYRYIFRYLSQRSILGEDIFYDRYIAEHFETHYVPRMFERVCREYLIRRNREGEIEPPFDRIGKYYYDDPVTRTNGEFDIVTEDPEGYIFYEAKFRRDPVTYQMIEAEKKQVQAAGLKCRKYGFFSRSGFACEEDGETVLIGIDELYK